MKFTKAALAAIIAAGGAATILPVDAASAQRQPAAAQTPQLSKKELEAVRPLYTAVQAKDWAAANAALPAAQAGVQTPAGRYLLGQLLLEIGRGTNDQAVQARAVDAMIASGGAPADQLPQLLGVQATVAFNAGNFAAAESAITRILEANPNDSQRIVQLATVKLRLNKRDEALALYRRAIQLAEAGGQKAPEDMYKRALAIAYEGRMTQPALEFSKTLVRSYPSATNWRDALIIYRQLSSPDQALTMDLNRLMRAAGALASEADYVVFADELSRGGLVGEVKGVLDEGVRKGVLRANHADVSTLLASANSRAREDQASLANFKRQALAASNGRQARTTADAYYGYGQYGEAAELYRAALQKGGEDANLVNLRLGASLALAGRKSEAEAALKAVTGPRAELANYWLLWLAGRP